jgi:MSHA biogenesis protein MshO
MCRSDHPLGQHPGVRPGRGTAGRAAGGRRPRHVVAAQRPALLGAWRRQAGFTLLEAILTIAITGIVAGMVAVFLRQPIDAFVDSGRRAELTDAADTALRRIARDVRRAVPNSLRVAEAAGVHYIELIPARSGGRYRVDESCFASGCGSLSTMGSLVDDASGLPAICTGAGTPPGCLLADRIVIYNAYNNAGGDCAVDNPSVYCEFAGGDNTSAITAVTPGGDTDVIAFAANRFVPANGSAAARFQVAEGPVTYACDPGSGRLTRHAGYALAAVQPTPPSGGSTALLADGITGCSLSYAGAFQRWALLSMQLTLARAGESITLFQQVHVDNAP